MSERRTHAHRAVWKIVDGNTQTFYMYGTYQGGNEMKVMEITYTGSPSHLTATVELFAGGDLASRGRHQRAGIKLFSLRLCTRHERSCLGSP